MSTLLSPLNPKIFPTSLISVGMFFTALSMLRNMYQIMSSTSIIIQVISRANSGFPMRLFSPNEITGNRASIGTPCPISKRGENIFANFLCSAASTPIPIATINEIP